MESFGERLVWVMGKRNITREKLSEMTGIGPVSLTRFITGYISPPPEEVIEKLAKALDVIPGYLKCETDRSIVYQPNQTFVIYEYRKDEEEDNGEVSVELNLTSDDENACKNSFLYEVTDNSIPDEKIGKGDKILINPEKKIVSGSLAAIKIKGGEIIIRRLSYENGMIKISGGKDDKDAVYYDKNSDEFEIVGSVVLTVNYPE